MEIKRRGPQIDKIAQDIRPEFREHFYEADEKFGWSKDYVIIDEDGNEIHTSNRRWAKVIASGGTPTSRNGKK